MSCRRSLMQHCVGVLWDVLDLHARHSAIMALRAPFRNRTRIPPVPGRRSLIGQPQIMDISIAMTFRTGNGSCGGWSYSVWVPVSYTHLRAHETGRNLVCRLLLEKK